MSYLATFPPLYALPSCFRLLKAVLHLPMFACLLWNLGMLPAHRHQLACVPVRVSLLIAQHQASLEANSKHKSQPILLICLSVLLKKGTAVRSRSIPLHSIQTRISATGHEVKLTLPGIGFLFADSKNNNPPLRNDKSLCGTKGYSYNEGGHGHTCQVGKFAPWCAH